MNGDSGNDSNPFFRVHAVGEKDEHGRWISGGAGGDSDSILTAGENASEALSLWESWEIVEELPAVCSPHADHAKREGRRKITVFEQQVEADAEIAPAKERDLLGLNQTDSTAPSFEFDLATQDQRVLGDSSSPRTDARKLSRDLRATEPLDESVPSAAFDFATEPPPQDEHPSSPGAQERIRIRDLRASEMLDPGVPSAAFDLATVDQAETVATRAAKKNSSSRLKARGSTPLHSGGHPDHQDPGVKLDSPGSAFPPRPKGKKDDTDGRSRTALAVEHTSNISPLRTDDVAVKWRGKISGKNVKIEISPERYYVFIHRHKGLFELARDSIIGDQVRVCFEGATHTVELGPGQSVVFSTRAPPRASSSQPEQYSFEGAQAEYRRGLLLSLNPPYGDSQTLYIDFRKTPHAYIHLSSKGFYVRVVSLKPRRSVATKKHFVRIPRHKECFAMEKVHTNSTAVTTDLTKSDDDSGA